MLSLRLDKETERVLRRAAEREGISVSEWVRRCVAARLARESRPTPWDLGKDRFGRHASGHVDRAAQSERLLKDKLHDRTGGG